MPATATAKPPLRSGLAARAGGVKRSDWLRMGTRLRLTETAELASYGAILIAVSQITGWPWVYFVPEANRPEVGDPISGLLLLVGAGAVLLVTTELRRSKVGRIHGFLNQAFVAISIIVAVALVFVAV